MNAKLKTIEQTVSMSLGGECLPPVLMEERVRDIGLILFPEITEVEVQDIIKSLQVRNVTTMSLGSTLVDQSHCPWLQAQNENINWYYWNRYKQLLIKDNFGSNVVGQIDIVTDEILDLLQNPNDEGKWQRKGLVVGHVQSGKTANYTGVVCKALDAGYRVIIIMAGLLNSLRKQTQGRIDEGVIGIDSLLMPNDISLTEKLVGVGVFTSEKWPVSITTAHADFNKPAATERQTAINQYKQPLVFVIKKNVSILKNLIDWLKSNNLSLSEYPMLLIDDEADHASVNTQRDDLDPTKTNERIRDLLELFPKNIYLGYTATPFANIFINPNTSEDMMNDLFPENFIKTLDAPSNYFGGERVFIENKLSAIKQIDDYDNFLPLKHKIDHLPDDLSSSLEESIRVFVLVSAIRILREQSSQHNSMLVNASRFTNIQSRLRVLIHNYLKQLQNSIINNFSLDEDEALQNQDVNAIFKTFDSEFTQAGFKWFEVQKILKKAISRMEVIEVNGSKHGEKGIDYSERNYPNGRHLIAVGGLSLSRGITLEGLSVTYFLRNSIMYDTLMQMGRWFGYRVGYEDLCRIYMTEGARGWYEHIANATEELRDEFRKMDDLGKMPKDFGLCVRNHPDSLIVTARNKMRSAKKVIREIELTGRLIETSRLFTDPRKVNSNLDLADNLLKRLKKDSTKSTLHASKHLFFTNVHYQTVANFIESFQNHPESSLTDSAVVKTYVENLKRDENISLWNVVFGSGEPTYYHEHKTIEISKNELKDIIPGIRRTTSSCTAGIMLSSRRLGSGSIDKVDLKEGEVRETPLLMIHLLDCRLNKEKETPIFVNGVVAYGISFPGEKEGRRIKKLATYQVNTTWMEQQYGDQIENDEDMGSDLSE